MIYCCVMIDYYSQLERSGIKQIPTFIGELKAKTFLFGATLLTKRMPMVFAFNSSGFFDKLQVAEAIEFISVLISESKSFLHGASVFVHEADNLEEVLSLACDARFSSKEDFSFLFSPQAKTLLSRYFDFDTVRLVYKAKHNSLFLTCDSSKLFDKAKLQNIVCMTAEKIRNKTLRLIHIEAGSGIRPVDNIAASIAKISPVLLLNGKNKRQIPFSPLIEAINAFGTIDSKLATCIEHNAFIQSLNSIYRDSVGDSVVKGTAVYIQEWLDAFGEKNGIVLCDSPELFSDETAFLINDRLNNKRGNECYISISDGEIINTLAGPWAGKVQLNKQNIDNHEEAIENALANTVPYEKGILKDWFSCIVENSGLCSYSVVARVLEYLPQEAVYYLYCLLLVGNELSPDDVSAFLATLGLHKDGEKLLRQLLSRAAFFESPELGKNCILQNTDFIALLVGEDAIAKIKESFSEFLISLYKKGKIKPSLGFLKYVGEKSNEEQLLFDCLFDDFFQYDNASTIDPCFLSSSSLSIYKVWHFIMAGDREKAETAVVTADDKLLGTRREVVLPLLRAELAYSSGDAEKAVKNARSAMIALGRGAPPKLTTRCQRIMGLTSLAAGRYTESLDYLTNALEMAEVSNDYYEKMMSSYAKAIVEFLSGAIGRAIKVLDTSYEAAAYLFRMDALAAIEALKGRIELELGAYDDAKERFLALASLGDTYCIAGVSTRAKIWCGRALSYSANWKEAIEIFSCEYEDKEAKIFTGEMEILHNNPQSAIAWLSEDKEAWVRRWRNTDSFSWESLFVQIEGRCLGFSSACQTLSDLRSVLLSYSKGLITHDPACAVDLHTLTRIEQLAKVNPAVGTYSFLCYLLEQQLVEPPIDMQTVLSRAFNILQQRAGHIEDRAQRSLYMEKNYWNSLLLKEARLYKFI